MVLGTVSRLSLLPPSPPPHSRTLVYLVTVVTYYTKWVLDYSVEIATFRLISPDWLSELLITTPSAVP